MQGDNRGELLGISEGIWEFADEKTEEYPMATPPGRLTPVNLFRDRDGGLWVGTLQRGVLHVYHRETSLFVQSDGLSGDRILSFFEDQEGNIWVGTMDGLDRFRETAVVSLSTKQGLSSPSAWSVLVAHDNSVWLSTLDGLNRWNNGHLTIYRRRGGALARLPGTHSPVTTSYGPGAEQGVTEITDPGLPDNLGSLYEDDRARIWVSSPQGIARFERGRFNRVKELPGGWVNAITGDTHAGVWISYQDQGLMHWVDGKVVESVPWSKLGGNVIAAAVTPDPIRGGLWLGFFQGGVVHFKDGQVHEAYGKKEGLGRGRVMGLQLDPDGTLWAATEGGLSRLKDGKIVALGSANGLPCDTVHWAVEVDASFWLYTACGLLRVARTELEKWASDPTRTVQFTILDSSDGVRSHALLTGYTPRVSKSTDGKLWFAHFQSVSVVDPHHLPLNEIAPQVHVEQITADHKSYDPAAYGNGRVPLPARLRDLEIDYTALSLAVPEKVYFRYKLEGRDRDWRDAGNRRQAFYSDLPPRNYRFRVVACNNSGVWNETGAFLDFSIAPAYYQTNWFRAVCVAAFLPLLWVLYQLRLHQLHEKFNAGLEARVNERTRIARELHDTLLQSFHGLLLRFQAASNLLPTRPEEAKKKLDAAIDLASQAVTEGRGAVQGLRASTAISNDLAVAIKTLGEELVTSGSNHECPTLDVAVEGMPRNLHPIVRDELYRIAGEAMRNAFRHAQANRVNVELHYDLRQLQLRIRDNGKGIESQVVESEGRAGHFGLHGMRERAKIIGANLELWSNIGSGTEVVLTMPASHAYDMRGSQQPSWPARKEV